MTSSAQPNPRETVIACRGLLGRASELLGRAAELLASLGQNRGAASPAGAEVTAAAEAAGAALEHARRSLELCSPGLTAEIALEELLETTDWGHPALVLGHPRPDAGEILEACDRRLEQAEGEEEARLLEVRRKVERARLIAEKARRRRERRRRRRAAKTRRG